MEQNETVYSTSYVLQIMQSRIEDLLAIQMNASMNTRVIEDALITMASNIAYNSFSSAELRIVNLLEDMVQSLTQITQTSHEAYQQLEESIEIPESTLESLRELSPLVPEEKREEFSEIIAPAKAADRKILTVENLKWLIGIILPIFLYLLPDKNAEEHNQLHKDSNEIARETVELLEPDSEEEMVEKFLKYLDDNGFALMKKDEVVYDQLEGIPNCVGALEEDIDAFGDSSILDGQNDNADDQTENHDFQP